MMEIKFSDKGTLTASFGGRTVIEESPVGAIVNGKTVSYPFASKQEGNKLILSFKEGECVLKIDKKERYSAFTVEEVPEGTKKFVFGPYQVKDNESIGEFAGCAWFADGSAVCIQALNPKTVCDCCLCGSEILEALYPVTTNNGVTRLQCSVNDMSKPERGTIGVMENAYIDAVEGEDGMIPGGKIALFAAENREQILETISEIELTYGLPHPTIDGEWTKTSKKTNSIYFIVDNNPSDETKIAIAERAGIHCVYFGDPFKSWGHFDINTNIFSEGKEGFRKFIAEAKKRGVDIGFHTLTNFIHTSDPYVSPVPHDDLQVIDDTVLTADISDSDTEIFVADKNNFSRRNTLNSCRIGDEIFTYAEFDEEKMCLLDCKRGAFGTVAASHKKGDTLRRLADHPYSTLFPSISLQREMAANIGNLIKNVGIKRMSFDGLEGCCATGRGEYACSRFIKDVCDIAGNTLLCDASRAGHYTWHATSYYNWGEPWYDDDKLGGMYNFRAGNQDFFKRNLVPGMLGWYWITCVDPKNRESDNCAIATPPEILETILSRTVGFDAGCCLDLDYREYAADKFGNYCDIIRLWVDFRASGVASEEAKAMMREQDTRWHLEKTETEWVLKKVRFYERCLNALERFRMESGTTSYDVSGKEVGSKFIHHALVVVDRADSDFAVDTPEEPLHFRIRLGRRTAKGTIDGFALTEGWGSGKIISFDFTAEAGDYLEYNGGKELRVLDNDLDLKFVVTGEGKEAKLINRGFTDIGFEYICAKDVDIDLHCRIFQTEQTFRFPIQ